jgi:hypothetical protein
MFSQLSLTRFVISDDELGEICAAIRKVLDSGIQLAD